MLLVPHTIIAIVIATLVRQPTIALPLAFLSHFALDAIPHWDPHLGNTKSPKFRGVRGNSLLFIALDFLIAFDLSLFFIWRALAGQNSLPDPALAVAIPFTVLLANLPDGLMAPFVFFGKRWGWLECYRRNHGWFQRIKPPHPWGVVSQVAVATIGLLILYIYKT